MDQETRYKAGVKKFWAAYTAIILCLIAFMVLVIAEDNEEVLFYSVMIGGFAYVFRPEQKFVNSTIKRFFDVDPPSGNEGD